MRTTRRIKTIDAHVAGDSLRLIVGGLPRIRGTSMVEKRTWLRKRWDRIRRTLVNEPRGHTDMCAAVLTEPVTPGSDAGVLFMDSEGYAFTSGHGIIAVVTIALERRLFERASSVSDIVLDTPAGTVTAHVTCQGERVSQVSFVNVPSFVLRAGISVQLGDRVIPVDVAFGGAFYAITDSESLGVPVQTATLSELRKFGSALRKKVESVVRSVHPLEPTLCGIQGVIITGLPEGDDVDLRSVTIVGEGQARRSPSGTGVAAVMAVADAMGVLDHSRSFVLESLIGTRLMGSFVRRTTIGEVPAIVTRIDGTAWITGDHEFLVCDDDPFRDGFRL